MYELEKQHNLLDAIGIASSWDKYIGDSRNVIYTAQIAKIQGVKVISLSGRTGGQLKAISDISINVPFDEPHIVQEFHLPIYHAICAVVENELFYLSWD